MKKAFSIHLASLYYHLSIYGYQMGPEISIKHNGTAQELGFDGNIINHSASGPTHVGDWSFEGSFRFPCPRYLHEVSVLHYRSVVLSFSLRFTSVWYASHLSATI